MSETNDATPRPWKVVHRCSGCTEFDDESCGLGLDIEGPPEGMNRGQFAKSADARLIVRAVNSHDALVEAAEAVMNDIVSLMEESDGLAGYHLNGDIATWDELLRNYFVDLDQLRAALDAAKEE